MTYFLWMLALALCILFGVFGAILIEYRFDRGEEKDE